MGFHAKFSSDGDITFGPKTGDSLLINETYHLEMNITQNTLKGTGKGEEKHIYDTVQ